MDPHTRPYPHHHPHPHPHPLEHPLQAGLHPDSRLDAVQGTYHAVVLDPHHHPHPHPQTWARPRDVQRGPPIVPESQQLSATRMQHCPRSYYFLHQEEEPVLREANSANLATLPFYIQC